MTTAVRSGEEKTSKTPYLAGAIAAIRVVTARAAGGDDPWILSEGIIDIAFAITQAGTISLGAEGELSDELTHTLRLRLEPPR